MALGSARVPSDAARSLADLPSSERNRRPQPATARFEPYGFHFYFEMKNTNIDGGCSRCADEALPLGTPEALRTVGIRL
jgi:hypothetical protein